MIDQHSPGVRSRLRGWRAKLFAGVVFSVVFFGLLEIGLRVAGYRYLPGVSAEREESRRLPGTIYARHPVLLWTLPPSTVIDEPRAGFLRVTTNSLGLRGGPPPGPRRPDEVRVLCLGDSVTFGMGLPDSRTWPAMLKRFLSANPELAGRPVHVLNGGVPGWSSVQGMRLLDRMGSYEPDVIVFWFGMNDVAHAWGCPDAEKGGEAGVAYQATSLLAKLRTVQLVANAVDGIGAGGEYATRASREDYAAAVRRLRSLEAEGGPRVIFVRYPERLEATESQLARVVARAEEEGVEWVSGPAALLLAITPAPRNVDLIGRVVTGEEGPELRFGGVSEFRYTLEKVRIDLADVRGWREGLAARLALLPADAPDAMQMFGETPPGVVFSDNIHLTAQGCSLAARLIAARVLSRIRR